MAKDFMNTICGIDYSLSSPAITVWNGINFTHHAFKLRKFHTSFDNYVLYDFPEASDSSKQAVYEMLSEWSLRIIKDCSKVVLEDYSFASNGNITSLAENCGLLKHKLWKVGIEIVLIAPSSLKKYATGSGKAKKEEMYENFVKDSGRCVLERFRKTGESIPSPLNDIVDSYYLCKMGI